MTIDDGMFYLSFACAAFHALLTHCSQAWCVNLIGFMTSIIFYASP